MTETPLLPDDADHAVLVGRVWRPGVGPCVVTVRNGDLLDITGRGAPTVRDLCELPQPVDYVRSAPGECIGTVATIAANSWETTRDETETYLLAPIDLQAVKAAGVTFAVSLLERVIEEQARGDARLAASTRAEITALIGLDLSQLKPGSDEALRVKQLLIERGAWSQYLEVGIGPDPEIFTKAQPMSGVGYGAHVGVPPFSHWNNPEPEVVLICSSDGAVKGATLGNDVNLRDVEGRSALLLGKAKDNNASAALGPFIRLLDQHFTIDDVRGLDIALRITGQDNFVLDAVSSMRQISRDPLDLARAACGAHHRYPDGFALYLGTMFAPVQDRDGAGRGFTHKQGDRVEISTPRLGSLANIVHETTDTAPWTFGAAALMRNLAQRGLI
ncbi:MAG TPA: fumarylacetoacetate hydrolase family protein [Caulobacterales bacterium]|nr:fumarylacetoacetate hydrolase family protein [Caulobacterales bacterium]